MVQGRDSWWATSASSRLFVTVAAEQPVPALMRPRVVTSGTHTAKGYTSESAETASVEGLKQDCDNINLNKKLALIVNQ
jgi:hypothetical protein